MEDQIKDLMSHASPDMAADKQKQKLCAIEDIIKAKQLLYGMGVEVYKHVVLNPAAEFDRLNDLSLQSLITIDNETTAEVNKTIQLKFKKQ